MAGVDRAARTLGCRHRAIEPKVHGCITDFRLMVGSGDLVTALLALIALLALRYRFSGRIALVWFCVGVGLIDTIYAIVQSLRCCVFNYALGVNWVIVTCYVPALLVSSLLIFLHLLSASPRRIPHAVTTA